MKRVVSLLLIVVVASVLLTFSGCTETAKFVGTWECAVDVAEGLNYGIASADGETGISEYVSIETFEIVYILVFHADGTYSRSVDEAAFDSNLEALREDLRGDYEAYLSAVLQQAGLTVTVDEYLSMIDMDMDTLVEEAIAGMSEVLAADFTAEGNFEVSEGKLYLSDGLEYGVDKEVYECYEITDTTLTLTEGADPEVEEDAAAAADAMSLYPMVFNKVD